jgi:hypothetical protein
MIRFLIQFLLAVITWILTPIVHIACFIVVLIKYKKDAIYYFDNMGLEEDIRSSSKNRTLWNFLFVKKNGYRFVRGTTKSISRHIGINFYMEELKILGYVIYYILYVIDFTSWNKGGHCKNAVKVSDLI